METEPKEFRSFLESRLAPIYQELHKAAERMAPGRLVPTLGPTALLHEAFLRLLKREDLQLNSTEHLKALVFRTMRQVIADYIRNRGAEKRGKGYERLYISDIGKPPEVGPEEVMDLYGAIEELEARHPSASEAFHLQHIGYSIDEIGEFQQVDRSTASRRIALAKQQLSKILARSQGETR